MPPAKARKDVREKRGPLRIRRRVISGERAACRRGRALVCVERGGAREREFAAERGQRAKRGEDARALSAKGRGGREGICAGSQGAASDECQADLELIRSRGVRRSSRVTATENPGSSASEGARRAGCLPLETGARRSVEARERTGTSGAAALPASARDLSPPCRAPCARSRPCCALDRVAARACSALDRYRQRRLACVAAILPSASLITGPLSPNRPVLAQRGKSDGASE